MLYLLISICLTYLWSGIYPVIWYITYKNNWNYNRFERDWSAVYKLGLLILMANILVASIYTTYLAYL